MHQMGVRGGDLPCAFGDGTEGHGLLDLGQRQHRGEDGQGGQPRVAHVVVGKVVVGVLTVEFN